jgi:tetratricopeptide (TPR) repeat protein
MHNNLGNAYHRRGELDLAEREYRAALEADPSSHTAFYNLGNLALDRGRLDEAERLYRRTLALQPDSAEAAYNLGVVAHRRGDDGEALRWLERAAALQPLRAETHLTLGMTLLDLDRDRGVQHLRRFLALAPDHPQAPAVRALLTKPPLPPHP